MSPSDENVDFVYRVDENPNFIYQADEICWALYAVRVLIEHIDEIKISSLQWRKIEYFVYGVDEISSIH